MSIKRYIAKLILLFFKKTELVIVKDDLSVEKNIKTKQPINLEDIINIWNPPLWYKTYKLKKYSYLKTLNSFITEDGVIYNVNELIKESVVYDNFKNRFGLEYFLEKIGVFNIKLEDEIILIWNHWGKDNYYHWIIDSLSNLIMIEEFKVKCTKILLPPNPPQFVLDSLKSFNIELVNFSNGKVLKTKQLIYPIYPASSGKTDAFLLKKIKEQFLSYISNQNLSKMEVFDKVYVSRSRQKKRSILNENILIKKLEVKGFKVIYFEDYTFWEQIYLMKHATVLVAPHGANMVNMLVMPENSKVIEINNEDVSKATLCYWSMASNLGFNYYYVPADFQDDHFNLNEDSINLIDKYC